MQSSRILMAFLSLWLDLLKNMMFELPVSHSRHYNRSFPLLSPDLQLIFNQTWFTKYLVKVKNDHRSKFSNLRNWKEEAWKIQGFNRIRTRKTLESRLEFFRLVLSNCLKWKNYCDDHASLWSTTAVQIYGLFDNQIVSWNPYRLLEYSIVRLEQ